jgi:hypothetical protein
MTWDNSPRRLNRKTYRVYLTWRYHPSTKRDLKVQEILAGPETETNWNAGNDEKKLTERE